MSLAEQLLGSTEGGTYPAKFDESSTLWRAALPGKGCSTPIVLNRTIYLTAPVNGNDAVLAIDWSGKPIWTAVLGKENPGKHRNGSTGTVPMVFLGRYTRFDNLANDPYPGAG